MPAFHDSIVIDAPPDEVFRFMENAQNAPKWMPDVEQVEPLKEPGEHPDGARFRETRRMGKRRISALVEVSRSHFSPGRSDEESPGTEPEMITLSPPGTVATYQFTISGAVDGTTPVPGRDQLRRSLARDSAERDVRRPSTRVDLNATVEPDGIFGRLFVGRLLRELQAADAGHLTRLKGAIEREQLVEHLGPL